VTRVASSHQKSLPGKPSSTASEYPNATTSASEIRVITPGVRARSSAMAPVRNTRPPRTNTAMPNPAATYSLPGNRGPGSPRISCRPVEKTSVGIVRARQIKNSARKFTPR
jgi:hypothetical protein